MRLKLLLIAIAMFVVCGRSYGQTNVVKFDLSTLPGGTNLFGASPLTPTTSDANITIVGLTRGSGMTTTGTAASKAWGGLSGNTSSTQTTGISSNNTATFSITPKVGYKVSLTQIPAYNIRRSSTGFTTGIWQYSVNGSAYTDIGTAITWGNTTTSAGNAQAAISLSGITALQNVAAGITITLRVVLWSASATGGAWYFNDQTSGTTDLIVTGTVAAIPSSDATLSALTTTAGTLTPSFASATIGYTATVPYTTTSVTVTPTRNQANATIQARVNGGSYYSVTSGSASGPLNLNVGSNTIDVEVTAQDGTTIKTYTITVTRAAASNDATLSALTTTATGLSPVFASGTNSYTASAANATTSVTVTPTSNQANATIAVQVNGGGYSSVTSGSASGALNLNVGSNAIDIKVTAQDGTTINTYTITVTRAASTDEVNYANVQFPGTGNIIVGGTFNVYAQTYEPGVTEAAGAGTGIVSWIGYNTVNNDPSSVGWTWVSAAFSTQSGNNDEFVANIGAALPAGTYYYASRFQLNGGPYKYGGFSSGFWDGSTNKNGVLSVDVVDWANLQSPSTATIVQGSTFNAYGQVFEPGVTNINASQGAGITVEFGISPVNSNTNPNTWTNWTTTTYNNSCLSCGDLDFNGIPDNDEYSATTGGTLTAGTYYYTFRYKLNSGPYVYGGFNAGGGGFWNGTTDVSGVLTVVAPTITISTTTLSGFTYVYGSGPSTNQNYTVSGANLTANILLTAPTNYEICLTAVGTYVSSLTLTQTGGTVTSTTIYVRLKAGLAIGSYNGEIITATSTGATQKDVTCSGSVTMLITNCVSEDFLSFTDWTDNGSVSSTFSGHYGVASPCRGLGIGASMISPAINNPNSLKFHQDNSNPGTGTIDYRIGTGSWISCYSFTTNSSGVDETVNLTNIGGVDLSQLSNITFRFNSSFNTWYLDDVVILCGSSCTQPSDPTGTISEISPSCGSTTLSTTLQNANWYWQTTPSGTSTSFPTTLNYNVTSSGTYYIRAKNAASCWSSGAISYTATVLSSSAPTITSPTSTLIATITATLGGNITAVGCNNATVRGIEWSTTNGFGNGTGTQVSASGSFGTGVFTQAVTGLPSGTVIYYKAFATNPQGTVYTTQSSFTTLITNDLCNQSTSLTVNATATNAIMNGSTTASPFTAKDVWFSFTPSCSGTHNIVVSGFTGDIDMELYDSPCPASLGIYLDISNGVTSTETITGSLSSGTTYYIRILAYNTTAETSAFTIQVTTDGTLNIANTGSPVAGGIVAGTNNVVIMGFSVTPNCATSYSLTGLTITKTGTSTISDLSNFRIFYDANNDGSISGDSSVSGLGIALANSMTFTLSLQTGFTTARRYLLVADVALAAVNGNTIIGSISLSSNVTATLLPTGFTTGNAIGNTLTISPPTCTAAVLTSITPATGPVGTEVTIKASSGNLAGATVKFNGITATVVSSSALQIVVLVPNLATTGNITITDTTPCNATIAFTVITQDKTSCQGGNAATDLFISEVTDSNYGSLTYVEIYNGTGLTVNLSGYSIKTANNGASTFSNTVNLNNVDLASGGVYVVGLGVVSANVCPHATTPGADGSYANQTSGGGSVNFDTYQADPLKGNDFIGLYYSGGLKDSWGEYKNASWAPVSIGPLGANFKRLSTATPLPNPIYTSSNWTITDVAGSGSGSCVNNDYSGIRTHNFTVGAPPTVTVPTNNSTCKTTSLTVIGGEGYNGAGDTKELKYQWYVSAPNVATWTPIDGSTDGSVYTNFTTATLDISNNSGKTNYQYYCQISEDSNTCYVASNAVKIVDGTITWNGTDWRDVNNAITTPSLSKLAVINANYNTTTNGDLNACSLIVNAGKLLTVTKEKFVTIQNDLTVNLTGKLEVEDKGSLVMINDLGTVTNNGTTNILRSTSTFEKYDYVYWSTPIASDLFPTDIETTFISLVPNSTDWRIDNAYEFNPANYVDVSPIDGFDDNHDDWTFVTSMYPGKGYIIMVPEAQQITDPPVTSALVIFSGKVNNGVVTTPVALTPAVVPAVADDDFNLVGNPYPSAISADEFIKANISGTGTINNTIEGTLYFWTHKKDIEAASINAGPDAFNYSQDDYAVYTLAGGIGTSGSLINGVEQSNKPNGYIASGQGFFVEAATAGTVTFNNAMRVGLPATANSQFYKSRSGKSKIVTKDRIWLNLENSLGMFSQQLVGYFYNTTLGYDNGYDGLLSDAGNYVDFYSFIDDKTYKIQGRSTFDENDQVRLGYFSAVAGTFNINIDSKEGVFTTLSTPVYLEDKLLNVIYDLKQSPYTFTTEKGTFNDRFILRYTNKTLGNKDFETLENQVLVSNKNKQIKVNSAVETIDKVVVYDLLGRQLFKKDKVNSNELTLTNLASNQQTLLVKVSLQNGQTVTKKIIY